MIRPLHMMLWLAATAVLALGVYGLSWRDNIGSLTKTADIRLSQAADRMLGQLESFRELPNFLGRHPQVIAALQGQSDPDETGSFLLNFALTTGADGIYVTNINGQSVGSSDSAGRLTLKQGDTSDRPDIISALDGSLGVFHTVEGEAQRRVFYISRGVIDQTAPPIGTVSVKVGVAQLEFEWRVDEDVVVFKDPLGVVFSTNRQELALTHFAFGSLSPGDLHYLPQNLKPFPRHSETQILGHEIWRFEDKDTLPQNALVRSRFIPQIDMTAQVFVSTDSARRTAGLQAALAGAAMSLLGMVLLVLAQRRKRLSEQLALEEAANLKLEARVSERTEQLQQAQEDLVQAGKMSALGQMSAGISHELNQPLSAIQTFAENAKTFLERGRDQNAAENLTLITEQTHRMDRIIRNLRAFARRTPEKSEPVDLVQITKDALKLAEQRLQTLDIHVSIERAAEPIIVKGGHVRLQQVVLNLISNAADAMEFQDQRQLALEFSKDTETAFLKASDTGVGLTDPSRVFEPFYSTKDVGASKGMGLGLSISYGIVGSFGGDLKAANQTNGGAQFILSLPLSQEGNLT